MSQVNRRTFWRRRREPPRVSREPPGGRWRVAESPASSANDPGQDGHYHVRVGQGTGMHGGNRQSNHTRMGFEKLVSLLRHDYERGITFFDMADLYGTHVYFREALRQIPRDKISILSQDVVAI